MTYSTTANKRIEELMEREDKIFAQRDNYEREINKVLGVELTTIQFLKVAQLFADIERCDQGIERIKERISDLAQSI